MDSISLVRFQFPSCMRTQSTDLLLGSRLGPSFDALVRNRQYSAPRAPMMSLPFALSDKLKLRPPRNGEIKRNLNKVFFDVISLHLQTPNKSHIETKRRTSSNVWIIRVVSHFKLDFWLALWFLSDASRPYTDNRSRVYILGRALWFVGDEARL